jgi:Skp family chaperone for outer membrane proteins
MGNVLRVLFFVFCLFAVNIACSAPIRKGIDISSISVMVVDIEKVMNESLVAKDIKNQEEKKQNELVALSKAKEANLQKEYEDIKKLKTSLSQEAWDREVKGFEIRVNEVQRSMHIKRSELQNKLGEALLKVENTIRSILEEMSKERNVLLVIPTTSLLNADASLHVTDEVLDRLNKRMSKLNFDSIGGA